MKQPTYLRLLASATDRGDLFTRLVQDLFFALGYEDLRVNVHKTGREIDIQGRHRWESRGVLGECKATADKIGGADLNKFLGVLTRERKKDPAATGYFVSLSGFTETGIEQEMESGEDGLILLDAAAVAAELEKSHVLVSRDVAIDSAGRCIAQSALRNAALFDAELLGHEHGYIWAVYYAVDKSRTGFVLIHADGQALGHAVGAEIIESDKAGGGDLHTLQFIAAPMPQEPGIKAREQALSAYKKWLGEEFGYIQLDGLPADSDLSATRLKLERLFVPLRAIDLDAASKANREVEGVPDEEVDRLRHDVDTDTPIGRLIEQHRHIAFLAMPGGGKSTLLKRLATAYMFPERRGEVDDNLPEGAHLPLVLRCRDLRDRSHRPILELLNDVSRHLVLDAAESAAFEELVLDALRSGSAMLLIDGLDEISDKGSRLTFATHLRTFIAMFPLVRLVVTSREAGFRDVAGVVASLCAQARFAPLNREEAVNLCERWHVEVVTDSEKVKSDAIALGNEIWDNSRIRTLARNPLLLTTLLVVKRNVGELPRNRTALYREAIRVLVRTWNVEGYAAMDEDETLAQLSYVACEMMKNGQQQVGQQELLRLLQGARKELQAELQFVNIAPQTFIERIEYRSSLLMQTGFELNEDQQLEAVYEFRHLTFQEYLAAYGLVKEQYAGRDENTPLVDMLEPYFDVPRWREVISLSAVLAGRKAEAVIQRLVARIRSGRRAGSRDDERFSFELEEPQETAVVLLLRCLADEVQLTPATLRNALKEVVYAYQDGNAVEDAIDDLLKGKFGALFSQVVREVYFDEDEARSGARVLLCNLIEVEYGAGVWNNIKHARDLRTLFDSEDVASRTVGALLCVNLAFHMDNESDHDSTADVLRRSERLAMLERCVPDLSALLDDGRARDIIAAAWALAWLGICGINYGEYAKSLPVKLCKLWQNLPAEEQSHHMVWAFAQQDLLARDEVDVSAWGDCDAQLLEVVRSSRTRVDEMVTALVVGWYRRSPWTDEEIIVRLRDVAEKSSVTDYRAAQQLITGFGLDPGDFTRRRALETPLDDLEF